MLRSYQYTEKSYLDYSMQSNLFQMKEIGIARQYVENHHIRHDLKRDCPICNKDTGQYFFTKWDVDYLRCEECGSVFAVCDEEDVEGYLKHSDLIDLRLSEAYQRQIAESRQMVWRDFIEWLEVRSYRFLKRNKNLSIVDMGNRLLGQIDMIRRASICNYYELRDTILQSTYDNIAKGDADIVLYNDAIKTEFHLKDRIERIKKCLKPDGIVVIGARAGSGFDILTLKEHNTKIYPYEHILLPSVKGIMRFLQNNGFDILEITTPGVMDVKYVLEDLDKLDGREGFVKQLLMEQNESVIQEFQRFLQKSCMSSLIRVIARKAG